MQRKTKNESLFVISFYFYWKTIFSADDEFSEKNSFEDLFNLFWGSVANSQSFFYWNPIFDEIRENQFWWYGLFGQISVIFFNQIIILLLYMYFWINIEEFISISLLIHFHQISVFFQRRDYSVLKFFDSFFVFLYIDSEFKDKLKKLLYYWFKIDNSMSCYPFPYLIIPGNSGISQNIKHLLFQMFRKKRLWFE